MFICVQFTSHLLLLLLSGKDSCHQISSVLFVIEPRPRVIFALQSKSNDEVAGLGGGAARKIGYHPVLGERSGRKMVQRAMSLAQTK